MSGRPSDWSLRLGLWLARIDGRIALLAAFAAAACTMWGVVVPGAERRASRVVAQAAVAGVVHAVAPSAADTPEQALASFEARLADDDARAALMRALWSQAQAAGVRVAKVDFREEPVPNGRYRRLHLSVPMTGTYPMVRQLLFGLLAQQPALALARLDFKRDQPVQAQVEATAHLILMQGP